MVKVADRSNMCYIFEKVMVRGPQKQCSQVSDIQMHKNGQTLFLHGILMETMEDDCEI